MLGPDPSAAVRTPSGETAASGGLSPESPPFPVPDHTPIRRVGKGAYGEVWLARNALGTWRAVKFVRRSAFDDDRPFEREFAGIQQFEPISRSHESQLNVLHVGRAEDGFYYVMELADDMGRGQEFDESTYTPRNLRSELHLHGRLPVSECLRIGLALTTALEHLHKHGLVHRDIKPSNIVFVNGIPKLADIGLVARAEATASFVGTEGFLPPEGPGTRQADIYSLGKVLYEISTGHDRNQFPELPTNIIELPDRAELSELNEILLKACHRDPNRRYPSAAEMHADLALLESGRSVVRLRGLERRLRIAQRVGVAVLVLAMLIAGGWSWQARQTRLMRQLAEEKTRLAEDNRQRIVRLDIANGVRLLDEGDPAGALLWFADALPRVTNNAAEESIHRVRIQQSLNRTPRVLQVFPHKKAITAIVSSDDNRRIVTGTEWGDLSVWDAGSGSLLCGPLSFDVDYLWQVRFVQNGHVVFTSSLRDVGFAESYIRPTNTAALISLESGRQIFSVSGTNLLRADLSPNERWLVTADEDHIIHVYDAQDGKAVGEFEGHTNRILQFVFSTTNVLASCSEDQTIRLWELPSGKPLGTPIPHEYGPIALSQDGQFLACTKETVGDQTNTFIQIWEVSSGTQVGRPIEMPGRIAGLGFRPQSESALFVITLKQCGLFDVQTRERRGKIIECPNGYFQFSLSPDGRLIAFAAGKEGLLGAWSLETGEQLVTSGFRDRTIVDFNFTPDALRLFSTTDSETATLCSLHLRPEDASHRFDAVLAREGGPISSRFTPDRRFFLQKLEDNSARMLDFERMTDRKIPIDSPAGLSPMQFGFDASGRRYAIWYSGAGTNIVVLWTEDSHATKRFVLPHSARLEAPMLFTSDGSHLITPSADHRVQLWRTADGTLERAVAVPTTQALRLLPGGRKAFIVSAKDHRFSYFDFVDGTTTGLEWPPFSIAGFAFSPAGDQFALTGGQRWTRVWRTRDGKPLTGPFDHGGEVRSVDWSPDGTRLLTVGQTPELRIWDASTGEQTLAPLRLGTKAIEDGTWSVDGRFIVGISDENEVRVWDAATGEPITPVLKHAGKVRLAQLVANRLVTLSLPNMMRAWDLPETRLAPDVIADYAKLVSGRRLKAAFPVPLDAAELTELSKSLHVRAPELFE